MALGAVGDHNSTGGDCSSPPQPIAFHSTPALLHQATAEFTSR